MIGWLEICSSMLLTLSYIVHELIHLYYTYNWIYFFLLHPTKMKQETCFRSFCYIFIWCIFLKVLLRIIWFVRSNLSWYWDISQGAENILDIFEVFVRWNRNNTKVWVRIINLSTPALRPPMKKTMNVLKKRGEITKYEENKI